MLIFEDDYDLAEQWINLFALNGISASYATKLDEAVTLCQQHVFDLVVCDIFVKDDTGNYVPEGGLKLLHYLKLPEAKHMDKAYIGIPKIAVSGARQVNKHDILTLAQSAGCSVCMRKPFKPKDLLEKVAALI